jgi:diketogulonate reductase-like aldo/keto reductase
MEEAYSPLTRGRKLGDPALVSIAKRHGKTSAQVLIRWCLEKRFVAQQAGPHP